VCNKLPFEYGSAAFGGISPRSGIAGEEFPSGAAMIQFSLQEARRCQLL
jgi:hypothetical protein